MPAAIVRSVYEADDPARVLRELLDAHPTVEAAIRFASPSLYQAIHKWRNGCETEAERTVRKTLSYVVRMCTRPTPFGLFSGIGAIDIGPATTLAIPAADDLRASIQPSAAWLAGARLEPEGALPSQVVTNDLTVTRGNRYYAFADCDASRAFEADELVWRFNPVSIARNAAVDAVRELATAPIETSDLVGAIAARFAAAPEVATSLVTRLLKARMLVPTRSSLLRTHGDRDALTMKTAVDAETIAHYEAELAPTPASEQSPLCIDTFRPFSGTLGDSVLDDLGVLASIMASRTTPPPLHRLLRRFIERYEAADRLVPLLEIVHETMLADERGATEPVSQPDARDTLLAQLAGSALRERSEEIEIDTQTLRKLYPDLQLGHVPNACEIGFHVEAESLEAIATGNYRICPTVGAHSDDVGKTINRYADAFGLTFRAQIEAVRAADRSPDCIDAEIDFIPLEPGYADLLVRGRAYEYVIADASISLPAGLTRISPSDVLIGYEGNAFTAYSRSLGKRLRLHESYLLETAYFAPPHARVLALIAAQNRAKPKVFSWGQAASHLPYLPRVRYGRLILAPAHWIVPTRALAGDLAAFSQRLAEWRSTWSPPRYIVFAERDMKLPVDLDSPTALALLHDQLARYRGEEIIFQEFLPGLDRLWLRDEHGRGYVSEFVATLPPTSPPPPTFERPVLTDVDHAGTGPGGQWAYLKVYGAHNELDVIVREHLSRLLDALANEPVERWFFLRYRDPNPHIRLRLHSSQTPRLVAIMSALLEPLVADGSIARYAFDTYQPEFARYGGARAFEAVERLFSIDSERALRDLSHGNVADRFTHAHLSMAPTIATWFKHFPVQSYLDYYSVETRAIKETDYATVRALQAALAEPVQSDPREDDAIATIAALHAEGNLAAPPTLVLASLIHMHCNRLGLDYDDEPLLRAHLWRALYGNAQRARSVAAIA